MLAICRGMQMLCVVSGAEMIQDIPRWFEAQGIDPQTLHRDPKKEVFVPHSVHVLSHDSLLYKITGTDTITKVPSWHHQAVDSVDNEEEGVFMEYDAAMALFHALLEARQPK